MFLMLQTRMVEITRKSADMMYYKCRLPYITDVDMIQCCRLSESCSHDGGQ